MASNTIQPNGVLPLTGTPPAAELESTDFLDPQDDLNEVFSPIAQGIQPNSTNTLLPQLIVTDPLNTDDFPDASDILLRSDAQLNAIFAPNFGANLEAPLTFISGPAGIPIVDLGLNPEPLKILAAANAAPLSNVEADIDQFGFPQGIAPNQGNFGVVSFAPGQPTLFRQAPSSGQPVIPFGAPILPPFSQTQTPTAGQTLGGFGTNTPTTSPAVATANSNAVFLNNPQAGLAMAPLPVASFAGVTPMSFQARAVQILQGLQNLVYQMMSWISMGTIQ